MAVRPAVVRPPVQQSMTPKEAMGILRRHILMIILFTVAGTVIGTGSCILLKRLRPQYTATAAIRVLKPDIVDPLTIGEARMNQDMYDMFRNTMAAKIKSQTMLEKLLRRDVVTSTKWFAKASAPSLVNKWMGSSTTEIGRALHVLDKKLSVVTPRDTESIFLSMKCRSSKEAKVIVNEMQRLFLSEQLAEAQKGQTEKLPELKAQRDGIASELRTAKGEMTGIRTGSPYGNLNENTFRDYLTETLGDQETDLSRLQSETMRLTSLVEILRDRADGAFDDVTKDQIEQDPIARSMRNQIAMIEPHLAELLARFGENHRRVKEVRDALKQREADYETRKAFWAEIIRKANHQNARDQLIATTADLESQKARLDALREKHKDRNMIRARYTDAMIRRDEQQALLEELNTRIMKQEAISKDTEISKVISGGIAPEPFEMSSPRIQVFLPGGFILGLLAGLGLAFAVELLNDLVRSPSDVMKHLRVPLLGMICHADEDDDARGIEPAHVVRQAPYSIMSECYRQFRTNLKLSGGDEARKVLLVTSGGAGDGKTSIAANLAATLVAENKKVLLIDANFRRPMTTSLFPKSSVDALDGPGGDYGLSNYLMGQCELTSGIIRSSGVEDFDIIDSGPLPGSPGEVLASARMHELIETNRDVYDYIIIDGPPMLVSDAKTLAAQADGTILVFNTENTHRGAALRTLRELSAINARLVGTVLVGVKAMKGGYFQEAFRSYQDYQKVAVQSVA